MWKNMVQPIGPQDDNVAHELCMLVTWGYKHTLRTCYVTIIAFPLQQWLIEGASMLRYTFTSFLLIIFFPSIIFPSDLPTKVLYVFLVYVSTHAFLMSQSSNGEITLQHSTAGGVTLWVIQWNLSLADNVYSPQDLQSRRSKLQVSVLKGTFLQSKTFRSLMVPF
jgi:hypothetical protein